MALIACKQANQRIDVFGLMPNGVLFLIRPAVVLPNVSSLD